MPLNTCNIKQPLFSQLENQNVFHSTNNDTIRKQTCSVKTTINPMENTNLKQIQKHTKTLKHIQTIQPTTNIKKQSNPIPKIVFVFEKRMGKLNNPTNTHNLNHMRDWCFVNTIWFLQ
jgi:hypothetical protein